jgi:hypothetical protein
VSTEGIAGEELVELPGSHRNRADISGTLIDAPADDMVVVTIVLRRKNEVPAETMRGRARLSRAEFASRHGAGPADIERVQAFAQRSDLRGRRRLAASGRHGGVREPQRRSAPVLDRRLRREGPCPGAGLRRHRQPLVAGGLRRRRLAADGQHRVFRPLNDGQHLFWTGDFTGPGDVQVLFYDANDSNWWLGAVAP